ncbi:MAG: hypothetical protein ACI4TH_05685, partial [Candidatus Ornithomonoglobus sp.]
VIAGYEDGVLQSIRTAEIDPETGLAYTGGVSQEDIRIFVWDSLSGMKPILTKPAQTEWIVTGGADHDGAEYTLPNNSSLTQNVSGDFKLVTKLGSMTSRYSGIETGLRCGDIKLYKTYDESYKEKIIYNGSEYTGIPADKVKYLELSRTGSTVALYAGTSLADLESNKLGEATVSGIAEAGAYVSGAESDITVSKLETLRLSTVQTSPQAELQLTAGQRLLLTGETVDVTVTPDGSPITEIWLYLDGKPLASKAGLNITAAETVSIPVTFTTPENGTITAYCFDENLGKGEDSADVAITQDVTPWELTDIGASDTDVKSYVLATADYTYKIGNSSNGQIGGTEDKFAYLNQRVSGNMRMYLRLWQGARQFGVMFRDSLDAGSEYYYFCAEKTDDGFKYRLLKRDSYGGDTQLVEELTVTDDKILCMAERLGGRINIYETENNGIFTVKRLVASTECGLEDDYYLGLAAVSDGTVISNAGWVSLEKLDSAGTTSLWNFDNGLDWLWQMQDSETLAPMWTSAELAGNETGMMKLAPGSNYTAERYVFHVYTHGEGNKVINAAADVLVNGEDSGINVYLNANSSDRAFAVSFGDDGYIYAGGEKTDYTYDRMKWYTVSYSCDEGLAADTAAVTVREKDGGVIADITEVPVISFRSQSHLKLDAPVTNAIFFEPAAGSEGEYYIDNVSIDVTDSSIQKTVLADHFWNFGSSGEFDGLTALANGGEYAGLYVIGGADIQDYSKTIDGISFSKRYKIGGAGSISKKCVYFEVPAGTTDVTVYGESASSSEARGIVINDGEEHVTSVTSAVSIKYSFTSEEPKTIYVYGNAGINLYGISYETYIYEEQ